MHGEDYLRALRGDFASLPETHRIFRWFVWPERVAFPKAEELRDLEMLSRSALAYRGVLGACLSGQPGADALGELVEHPAYRELAVGWRAYFRGERVHLTMEASRDLPDARIHGRALLALDAIEGGELGEARKLARIATRMAKAEEAPQEEYLAAWALARTRRHSGNPHLTTRILQSLGRCISPAWSAVVGWEGAINGDAPIAPAESAGPWARAMSEWLRAGADFAAAPQLPAPFANESELARRSMDPSAAAEGPGEAWLLGAHHDLPGALSGLTRDTQGSAVWVYGDGAQHRRFVSREAPRMAPIIEGPPRPLHAIAALLLAPGARMDADVLFREVYGFTYEAALHKAAFKVLRHRVRSAVEGVGSLVSEDGVLSLNIEKPCVVPDPRGGSSLSEQVLRVLARSDRADAKSTSQLLGVPLRTVQRALQELVDDGDCVATKAGRYAAYRIEDTTFSAPAIRWREE